MSQGRDTTFLDLKWTKKNDRRSGYCPRDCKNAHLVPTEKTQARPINTSPDKDRLSFSRNDHDRPSLRSKELPEIIALNGTKRLRRNTIPHSAIEAITAASTVTNQYYARQRTRSAVPKRHSFSQNYSTTADNCLKLPTLKPSKAEKLGVGNFQRQELPRRLQDHVERIDKEYDEMNSKAILLCRWFEGLNSI